MRDIIYIEKGKRKDESQMMNKAIYFDMDGTIADLYGVTDWLSKLIAHDPTPYIEAAPLLRLSTLARLLNTLKRKGYTVGIVSWLSKCPNADYDAAVTAAKVAWLAKHLKSVQWDEIRIVPYGTPKSTVIDTPHGILFDDESGNRTEWEQAGGKAYNVDAIIDTLKAIAAA